MILLLSLLAVLSSAPLPAAPPPAGAVIESVDAGSFAESLGLRAGDVLVSWCRVGPEGPDGGCVAAGTIGSPFDLAAVDVEQVLRGGVRLEARRGEATIRVEAPRSMLRLRTRPVLSDEQLAGYREAQSREAAKDSAAAAQRLAAQAERPGTEPALAVWWLAQAAQVRERARSWPETDGLYRAAVERAAAGGLDEAAVELLRDWGQLLARRAQWDEARQTFDRCLALDRARGPDGLSVARTLNLKATAESQHGAHDQAETLLRQALALTGQLAPASSLEAGVLLNLANLAIERGDLAGADRLLERALVIEEQIGAGSRNLAVVLYAGARLAVRRGHLAKAEGLLRRELSILERTRPGTFEHGAALDLLAVVLIQQGDYASAESSAKKALAIKEKIDLAGSALAVSLSNLSHLARARGDFAAAEGFLERALALKQKAKGDALSTVTELNNLAAVAAERGDLDRAEALFQRVLDMHREADRVTLSSGHAHHGLGRCAAQRGQHRAAEASFLRALAILDRVAPLAVAESLYDLAETLRALGRGDETAGLYCRAAEAVEAGSSQLGGSELDRSFIRSTKSGYFDACLRSQVEQGDPQLAFATLERDRARVLLEALAERDLLVADDLPAERARRRRELAAEYDAVSAQLAVLDSVRDAARIEELTARLHAVRTDQGTLAKQIRAESPRFASLRYPQPLDLAGARATLDPETVLLAYAVGEEKTHAFLVLPSGAPGDGLVVRTLPAGKKQLTEAVSRYRRLLVDPATPKSTLLAEGARLYDLLVEPFAPQIDASRRLLISAHGPLLTLPFAALVRQGRYLVEWKPIHSVASATVYAQLIRNRPPTSAPAGRMVVFGDPAYPASLEANRETARSATLEVLSAVARGLALSPLPATRQEAVGIAGLFPNAEQYLGQEATEEQAKSLPRSVSYLHFACHGLLDEGFPLDSALALTIRKDPHPGEDNGLLQAWEIMESLRLDAELVTLSACDTALGKELGGEGLVGLTRAFQYAGARSVLASLWSIPDGSTAELMQHFYRHLRDGKSKDEALRLAQTALIRSRGRLAHPASWAAFQLVGDWR